MMEKIHPDCNLGAVISSGLCIACGACSSIDPSISLEFDLSRQIFRPNTSGNDRAAAVCPSVKVDYDQLHRLRFHTEIPGPLGLINSVHLAQSTNECRNKRASSGGLIKEAAIHLLSSGVVDGIISIRHDKGLNYCATIVRNTTEIDKLPGSIYHNIDLSPALRLLEENDERLAMIGIPCQLEGMYKYIYENRPHLKEKIVFTIGLLCAWQYTQHSISAICKYVGINREDIKEVIYRGEDKIGPLRVKLKSGVEKRLNRRANLHYQVAFDRFFNTPRCHICLNHLNFFADLVVGDCWLNSTRFSRYGISLAIARTPNSTSLLNELEREGRLTLHPVTEKEILESEGRSLVYGDAARSHAEALQLDGQYVPNFSGLDWKSKEELNISEARKFIDEMKVRSDLQLGGEYWLLWWRKIYKDGFRLSSRYLSWFFRHALQMNRFMGGACEYSNGELRKKFR